MNLTTIHTVNGGPGVEYLCNLVPCLLCRFVFHTGCSPFSVVHFVFGCVFSLAFSSLNSPRISNCFVLYIHFCFTCLVELQHVELSGPRYNVETTEGPSHDGCIVRPGALSGFTNQ